jgi:hypothetical protein
MGIAVFLLAWGDLLRLAKCKESVLIHHMGYIAEHGRGGSVLRGWCDAEWKLIRPDPKVDGRKVDDLSGPRFFSAYGRGDVDFRESKVGFDKDTHFLSIEGGNRSHEASRELKSDVMEYIRDNPGASKNKIEREVKGDNNIIREILVKAKQAETICVHQDGQASRHYMASDCPDPGDKDAHPSPVTSLGRSQRGKKEARRGKT